jgi:hydrogenase maturation protease
MAGRSERVLVVGVGNRARGDDGAGPEVALLLAALAPPGVDVLPWEGDLLGLLDRWSGYEHVVVVDATLSDLPAGSVCRLHAGTRCRSSVATSSHGLGVPELVALAQALGRSPPRLELIGIEGAGFEPLTALSPAVATATRALARRLARELAPRG